MITCYADGASRHSKVILTIHYVFLAVLLTHLLAACTAADPQVDELNSRAYAHRYRSLETTERLSREALALASGYHDGQAEALNNLAFVSMARMRYDEAQRRLDSVAALTDNQLELLIADIQQMRLCQRRSRNREFYDYRERAYRELRRIDEERQWLSPRQQQRLLYARSEMPIVESTYYYYVGQGRLSAAVLGDMPGDVENDTAQWLNYLYNVGAGGVVSSPTQEEADQTEFDYLMRCYLLSLQGGYPYFTANSLEALAEHLAVPSTRERLVADNLPSMKFFAEAYDTLCHSDDLPIVLAQQALSIFQQFGDVYQIAGAYRTLATCHHWQGDHLLALENLELALCDTTIYQAPDLVASIREQLSVAYAAIGDKQQSDQNRNIYLDLQEQTRQDRSLEARAGQLEHTVAQLNWLLLSVCAMIVVLIGMLCLFNSMYHRRKRAAQSDIQEQLAVHSRSLANARRLNLEQRARVSLMVSITPFIDRMLHAIDHASKDGRESDEAAGWSLDYVGELADKIVEQNNVLTDWIQLRKGELSLHIETFALQPLFDMLAKGRAAFAMKGITLNVEPTTLAVKADRVLTLFMLNTLADNARKFTPEGGTVSINATEGSNYVEIAVSDTGQGMDEEQLAHLFERKVISDTPATARHQAGEPQEASHGFGLLNCKGIIDKYRKVSQIFSPCLIAAESQLGKGSRLFFRLPKGAARLLTALAMLTTAAGSTWAGNQLSTAKEYADSAYFANIRGEYRKTLLYADSCRHALNDYYRELTNGTDTLLPLGDPSVTASEIRWLHDSLRVNYGIIIDMRNESAIAALALHEWELYSYNNKIYTQLFKETSADNSLDDYCRTMQQSRTDKTIAVTLLLCLLLAGVPAYYFLYYRRRRQLDDVEQMAEQLQRIELEEDRLHVSNAVLDNCLSTLKHETMYFPSRIKQMVARNERESLAEVAHYYRELYGVLSRQAMRQTEGYKLQLEPLRHDMLGDAVLTDYLLDTLRRQAGQDVLEADYTPLNQYFVEIRVRMPLPRMTQEEASHLFEPAAGHIPYLICKQIVREHGEAIHRTDFGIRAEAQPDGSTVVVLTMPRQRHPSTTQP